jgi:hypothetical protein
LHVVHVQNIVQMVTDQQLSVALFATVAASVICLSRLRAAAAATTGTAKASATSSAPPSARPPPPPAPSTATLAAAKAATKDAVHLPSEKCCGPRLLRGNGINEIYIHDIDSLRGKFPSAGTENTIQQTYNQVLGEEDYILSDIVRKHRLADKRSSEAYVRAGPRSTTHFEPSKVRAGIVTCGGLCPGLNNVIRELVHTLHFLYGANAVIGIRGGYAGFSGKKGLEPIQLTVDNVADIHHQGGTLLASSRGGFDIEAIVAFLKRERLSHLYVVGGDGTHRGAYTISEEVVRRQMNVAVVGIPKTIDNDVDLIDRSFGFTTSVEVPHFPLSRSSLSLPARPLHPLLLPALFTGRASRHHVGQDRGALQPPQRHRHRQAHGALRRLHRRARHLGEWRRRPVLGTCVASPCGKFHLLPHDIRRTDTTFLATPPCIPFPARS